MPEAFTLRSVYLDTWIKAEHLDNAEIWLAQVSVSYFFLC